MLFIVLIVFLNINSVNLIIVKFKLINYLINKEKYYLII